MVKTKLTHHKQINMNRILATFISSATLLVSCKKNDIDIKPLSSYIIVNATIDVSNAKVYAADRDTYWKVLPATDAAAQYKSASFSAYAGNNTIKAVSAADTNITLFSTIKPEEFKEAAFNTLFLCGNTGTYEGILINNDKIVNHTDSAIGIRFINLSPNSPAVSITLAATPTVKETTGLTYKQKIDFKMYPALQNTAAMVFQIRNIADSILTSYTLPVAGSGTYPNAGIVNGRFKNITLVVKGLYGTTTGTNAFGILPVPHY